MKAKKILAVLLTAAQLFGAAAFVSAGEPADVRPDGTAFTPTVTDVVTAEPTLIPAESGFDPGITAYPEIPAEEMTVEIPVEMPLPVLPAQDQAQDQAQGQAQDPEEREAALEKLKETELRLHGGVGGCDVHIPPFADLSEAKELLSRALELQNVYSNSVLVYSTEEAIQTIRDALIAKQDHILVEIEHVDGGPADEWYANEYDAWYEYVNNNTRNEVLAHTGVPTEGDYLRYQDGTGFAYGTPNVSVNNHAVTYINCAFSYYTTLEDEAQMDIRVPQVMASLGFTSSTTDYEKIKAIHDYICANVTYDEEHKNDSTYMRKHTAAAALLDGTAVCQGYAVLFYRMCLECGVDVRIARGIGGGGDHGWNIVAPGDGMYYYIDTTWDAGDPVRYTYFLKGADSFCTDHTPSNEWMTEAGNYYAISDDDYKGFLTSGQCGDSMYWTLYSDGELSITGSGDMYGYQPNDTGRPPWYDIRTAVKRITFDEGIRSIGTSAFFHFYNLEEAPVFPSSLEVIGYYAFAYCFVLNGELTLHDNIDSIDFNAFYQCQALTSVLFTGTAPDYFGDSVFDGCADGFTVNCYEEYADSFTSDDSYDASAGTWHGYPLVIVSPPAPAGNIVAEGQCGANVFWTFYNDGLMELTGSGPMYDYSLDDQPYIEYMTQIKSLRICEGITAIGNNAFTMIQYHIESLCDLPSTLTSIGKGAFRYSLFSGTVRIPASVSHIGTGAFAFCPNVTEFTVASANPYFTSLNGCLYTKDCSEFVQYPCGKTGELSLHSNVKVIRGEACAGAWNNITGTLNLPDGLEIIEASAFTHCTGLTGGLVLPSTLTSIREAAFSSCLFTGDLVIPSGVRFIGTSAFYGCDSITAVYFNGAAPDAGRSIFGENRSSDFTVYCYADHADSFTSGSLYDASAGTWDGYPLVILGGDSLKIDLQPEDQHVTAGNTASFSVTASGGTAPYSYQWQYRTGPNGSWVNVSAASGRRDTYSLTAQARHNGYQYSCVVTDSAGNSVNSDIATLTVSSSLTITSQPTDQNAVIGSTTEFAVSVSSGTAPYAYQWQYRTSSVGSWTNVSAASGKTADYSLTAQARHNGYQYRCKITDATGTSVFSRIVTLTVGSPLTIKSQPKDVTVNAGQTASFSVTASGGTAPYTFQWRYRTGPNAAWVNVSAASGKTADYSLTAQARHNGYQYFCVVTDSAGSSVNSDIATLTVVSASPLTISAQPQNANVNAGQTASFSVTASGGTAPYSYQWQYLKPGTTTWTNVSAASGKTASYTLTAEARHNGFQYRCKVTDAAGLSVTSSTASLTVGTMTVSSQPSDVTVAPGETAVFTVSVSGGTAPYSYRWQYLAPTASSFVNVSAASGKTASYSLTAQARHDGYQYRCVVTDAEGQSVMSGTVRLTVSGTAAEALEITTQPISQVVTAGTSVTFSVGVKGGTAPYSYQWQYLKPGAAAWANVSAASGKTANYTFTAETRHDVYTYRCTVTDSAGQSVLSSTAILMVNAGKSTTPPDIDPDFGADFPVLDLTPEEEALWDLGELDEADLKVLAPVETSAAGLNLSASAEIITFTADFGDESSAFFGDLSVYDFDPAADTAEFDDTVSE